MALERLTVDHGQRIELPVHHAAQLALVRNPAYIAELVSIGPAFALVCDDKVVAIGGIGDHGNGRGVGWCFMGTEVARYKLSITRAARSVLAGCGMRRVEIQTRAGWRKAERFALALGFKYEAESPAFFEDGHTAARWGRY